MKVCIDCEQSLPIDAFNGNGKDKHRPECKSCEKKRKEDRRNADPLTAVLNNLADGILKRVKYAIDAPKNRIYKERGIKCLIGDRRDQVRAVLYEHFRNDILQLMENGEKPSVDRIDPYGHYEIDNIQIIPLKENLARASLTSRARKVEVTFPNGDIKLFDSVSEASRTLRMKRDTIYAGAANPGLNRKGYEFKIMEDAI